MMVINDGDRRDEYNEVTVFGIVKMSDDGTWCNENDSEDDDGVCCTENDSEGEDDVRCSKNDNDDENVRR